MILTIKQAVHYEGDEVFERKRSYHFFCAEHNSGLGDLGRLKEQLAETMRDESPIDLEMEDEGDYEGNLSWDKLTIHYARTIIEIDEGYNGIWEMKSFGRLRSDAQVDVSNELLAWLNDQIDACIEDIKWLESQPVVI